jgi:hypothetical protein
VLASLKDLPLKMAADVVATSLPIIEQAQDALQKVLVRDPPQIESSLVQATYKLRRKMLSCTCQTNCDAKKEQELHHPVWQHSREIASSCQRLTTAETFWQLIPIF